MSIFRLKGIKKAMKKLGAQIEGGKPVPGEVKLVENRGKETRYSYYYLERLVFTFGIPRGTRRKEGKFYYVAHQMHLQNSEYRELHDCPMSKECYNTLMIERSNIRLKRED